MLLAFKIRRWPPVPELSDPITAQTFHVGVYDLDVIDRTPTLQHQDFQEIWHTSTLRMSVAASLRISDTSSVQPILAPLRRRVARLYIQSELT